MTREKTKGFLTFEIEILRNSHTQKKSIQGFYLLLFLNSMIKRFAKEKNNF